MQISFDKRERGEFLNSKKAAYKGSFLIRGLDHKSKCGVVLRSYLYGLQKPVKIFVCLSFSKF